MKLRLVNKRFYAFARRLFMENPCRLQASTLSRARLFKSILHHAAKGCQRNKHMLKHLLKGSAKDLDFYIRIMDTFLSFDQLLALLRADDDCILNIIWRKYSTRDLYSICVPECSTTMCIVRRAKNFTLPNDDDSE